MSATKEMQEDALSIFLEGLTELSRKHKIGIAGQPVLFIMDDDDSDRTYDADDDSNLRFR